MLWFHAFETPIMPHMLRQGHLINHPVNLKVKGVAMQSITFELYRKSRDPKVLKKGPDDAHFWITEKAKKTPVFSLSENCLKEACYRFVRDVLRLSPNAYLRIVTCHYWSSQLRTSYWAWVVTSTDCYKCHAECAFMP